MSNVELTKPGMLTELEKRKKAEVISKRNPRSFKKELKGNGVAGYLWIWQGSSFKISNGMERT